MHTSSTLPTAGKSHDISHFLGCIKLSPSHSAFTLSVSTCDEPKNFHQAVKNPLRQKAMAVEISALESNNTWVLTTLSADKEAIGCRCIYKIKY